MKRAWLALAAIFGVLMILLPLLPQQIILYVVVEGLAVIAAIVAAVKIRTLPLYLLAAAFVCFFIGDNTYVFFDLIRHTPRSFPNVGDVFYLAFYPLAFLGLLLLIKRDLQTALDSILITLGLAVPWWLFIEYPNLSTGGYSFIERAVTVAYPLGDLLLIMLAVRVLFFEVPRSALYLGGGLVMLAATDSVYSIQQLKGTFVHGSWLDAGWFLFYVLWGLAFLSPFPTEKAEVRPAITNSRYALLFVAVVLPMSSVIAGLIISGQNEHLGYLVGVCTIVLMLCAVALVRVSTIARYNEDDDQVSKLKIEIDLLKELRDDRPNSG